MGSSSKCRRNAQCTCSQCEDSLNATRDLLQSGRKRSSSGKKSKSSSGGLLRSPAIALEPVFEAAAQEQAGRSRPFYRRPWFWALLIAFVEFVLPWILMQRPLLTPETVSAMVQEARTSRLEIVDRLDFLQHRIQRVVGAPVSNCTGTSARWTLAEDGPLVHSSCSLYASAAEQVAIWGFPVTTSGVLGRKHVDRSLTVLSGRVLKWDEGRIEYTVIKEDESWKHSRWAAAAVHLDKNTWIIEYKSIAKPMGGVSAAFYALRMSFLTPVNKIKWLLDTAAFACYSFHTSSPIPT